MTLDELSSIITTPAEYAELRRIEAAELAALRERFRAMAARPAEPEDRADEWARDEREANEGMGEDDE